MLGPGWQEGCKSCSFLADHIDGATVHLAHRDVTLVVVSRAPLAEIAAFQRRMGWRFKWVSSHGGDFNSDYHVSFSKDGGADGKVCYNYEMQDFGSEEMPGASVFYRDAARAVFHTYSAYARGLDMLVGAYNYLDLAPKGRDEDDFEFTMAWVRHHDRYDDGAQRKTGYTPPARTTAGMSRSVNMLSTSNKEMTMKLYGFPPSPNTWKVRAVAAHLGLPLELEFVDLSKGQQRTSEYLAINPTGRTPTLVDGDFVLWESNAIMQYLAGLKPNTLWPDDARARADIARWQSWQLGHFGAEACQPLIFQRLVKKLLNLGAPDAEAVAKGTEAFNRDASMLDAHLAKQPYLVGTGVTLADFAVAAPLFYAQQAELPLANYAHVRDWFARVSALPAWRETAPTPPAAAAA